MNKLYKSAIAIALLIGTQTAAQAGSEIFFDDFNGDSLSQSWEVLNEDQDSYIVEDGSLLTIATGGTNLTNGDVPNIFRLKQKLPKGDWVATMKFRMPYQTGRETPFLALYGDKDNHVAAFANSWSYYEHTRGARLYLSSGKVVKGKSTSFGNVLWGGAGGKPFTIEDAPNPFVLRITKKGHGYTAAVQIKKGAETTWVEHATVTSIRAPGSLAFGMYQATKVKGETPMTVDWVKIESDD